MTRATRRGAFALRSADGVRRFVCALRLLPEHGRQQDLDAHLVGLLLLWRLDRLADYGGERGLTSRRNRDKLTALERETLTLFASGRSYSGIAEARGISTVTVRNTLYRIQDKLGIRTKQGLVIWAVRNGLVDDIVVGAEAQPAPEEGQ